MTIRKNLSFFIVLAMLVFFLFVPMSMTFAATDGLPEFSGTIVPCGVGAGTGPFECGACDLIALSQNVINFLIFFATVAAVLMFVYAGFLYISALGDTGKIKKAHGLFINVFWGFIIVLAAWLIISFIMRSFLPGEEGTIKQLDLPWNEILCSASTPAPSTNLPPEIVSGTPS